MSGVEFGLAIAGGVDLCFKYGSKLVKIYKAIKHTDTEIQERIVSIEAIWAKISRQLDLLRQLLDHLDDENRSLQERIIPILAKKLEAAISRLSRVERKNNSNNNTPTEGLRARLNYAIFVKRSLEQAMLGLNSWQGIFDPSWYHMIATFKNSRLINSEVSKRNSQSSSSSSLSTAARIRATLEEDSSNYKGIFLPGDPLTSAQRSYISYSGSQLVKNISPGFPSCILDSTECAPGADIHILTRDVRTLAGRLRNSNPFDLKLLKCFGIVKIHDDPSNKKAITLFGLVFPIPEKLQHSPPKSLRERLLLPNDWQSINEKLHIAKQLAISISSVHTLGFVHKSIRPEAILIFENTKSSTTTLNEELFLAGFKSFRMEDGRSLRKGDLAPETILYQHPDRQGLSPSVDYRMQHDIYSLGVCLLEIGMEESFVLYEHYNDKLTPTGLSDRLLKSGNSVSVKESLLAMAKQYLPKKMGQRYTHIVINCLTCLDKDNEDFGDESQFCDEDGVRIGVAYIEKILLQLNEIEV